MNSLMTIEDLKRDLSATARRVEEESGASKAVVLNGLKAPKALSAIGDATNTDERGRKMP